jgi:hypothetical protein
MTTGLLVVAFVWGPSTLILAGMVVVECFRREPVPPALECEEDLVWAA